MWDNRFNKVETDIAGVSDDLLEEARKYDSADKFAKKAREVYIRSNYDVARDLWKEYLPLRNALTDYNEVNNADEFRKIREEANK